MPELLVIEVFTDDQAHDVGSEEYVLEVGARPDLTRDGQLPRDDGANLSQPGDVLSIQPDGSRQTRPAGTDGNFERCCKTSAAWVYRPIGVDGRSFIVPRALDAPNK